MDDDAVFVAGIRKQPANFTTRLLYAYWLEEQGDPLSLIKARYIRLEEEVAGGTLDQFRRDLTIRALRTLSTALTAKWKEAVGRFPICNCDVKWQALCPKSWDQLSPTSDDRIRYCNICEEKVEYCYNIYIYVGNNRCVAVDHGSPVSATPIILGSIDTLSGYADNSKSHDIEYLTRVLSEVDRLLAELPPSKS